MAGVERLRVGIRHALLGCYFMLPSFISASTKYTRPPARLRTWDRSSSGTLAPGWSTRRASSRPISPPSQSPAPVRLFLCLAS